MSGIVNGIELKLSEQAWCAVFLQAQHSNQSLASYLSNTIERAVCQTRVLGGAEHFLVKMSDDFDAPLDEWL